VAVIGALAIGAAGVALIGSAQRRDDRAAYLRYERAVLPSLRESGRRVQQEMKPALRELAEGRITTATALQRAAAFRAVFARIGAGLAAIDPPSFLGDISRRWTAAVSEYGAIADLFGQAARESGGGRARLLTQAQAAGERADTLFDRAAAVMQYHRRRLGLGRTTSLPDPATTASD